MVQNVRSSGVNRIAVPLDAPAPELIEGGRLAELYLRHSDAARRLAYLLTGDTALADDLTQEAFIRLAGRFMHIREPVAFEAYLRRTVVNLANSHFRRAGKERTKERRLAGLRQTEAVEVDLAFRDSIQRALFALRPKQRAAVVLRFYDDLSERQIAEVLGCRPGTVKSLISRAMEILRTEVSKEDAP